MIIAFIFGIAMGLILAIIISLFVERHEEYELTLEDGTRITGEIDNRMWLDMEAMMHVMERAAARHEEGSDVWATGKVIVEFLHRWMEEPTKEVRYGTVVTFDGPEAD